MVVAYFLGHPVYRVPVCSFCQFVGAASPRGSPSGRISPPHFLTECHQNRCPMLMATARHSYGNGDVQYSQLLTFPKM